MRLANISVKEIGGVEIADAELAPGLTLVAGPNGSGKSSFIHALSAILCGKKGLPEIPVREGAQKGIVEGSIVNADGDLVYQVQLRQSARGSTSITLTDADGTVISSPVQTLNELRAQAGIDPLAMVEERDPKKVRDEILKAVGVDTDQLDSAEKDLRMQREALGRDMRRAQAALEQHGPPLGDVPEEEVSVSALFEELQEAEATVKLASDAELEFDKQVGVVSNLEERIAQTRELLQQLELQHHEAQVVQDELQVAATDARGEADQVDLEAIRGRLGSVEDTNAAVRKNAERAQLDSEHVRLSQRYAELSRQVDAIPDERRQLLANSGLAVEGLELDSEDVRLNDRTWSANSTGERIKAAIQILLAMKAPLRVAWSQRGDALDQQNLQLLCDLCAEHDLQLILERIEAGDTQSLAFVDGRLNSSPAAPDLTPQPVAAASDKVHST